MTLRIAKCENCGAKLSINSEDALYCENCGTKYLQQQDINNTYITKNENITKNFYGNAAKQEIKSEKIDGYINRAIEEFKNEQYADARSFCMKILDKDPNNQDAIIIKSLLQKQSSRIYVRPNIFNVLNTVNYLLDDDKYKKATKSISLVLYALENSVENKDNFIYQCSYHYDELVEQIVKTNRKVEKSNIELKDKFLQTLSNIDTQAEKIFNDNRKSEIAHKLELERIEKEIARERTREKIKKIIGIVIVAILVGIVMILYEFHQS